MSNATIRRGVWREFTLASAAMISAASCSSAQKGPAGTVSADAAVDSASRGDSGGHADATRRGDARAGNDAATPRDSIAPPDDRSMPHDSAKVADAGCGGRTGALCGDGSSCSQGSDCQSGICQGAVCVPPPPSCTDGKQNGSETDVDCGGPVCPPCAPGKTCVKASDCTSDVCTGNTCQAPTATDGVKNDSETDVDCGGALRASGAPNPTSDGAPPCGVGKVCAFPSDCTQKVCAADAPDAGLAEAGTDAHLADGGPVTLYCQPPTPTDGIQNDSETDVDCGGGSSLGSDGAPPCAIGLHCNVGADCAQKVCSGGTCQPPSATDGVQNDSETDIDCGGATSLGSDGAPPCPPYDTCQVDQDCTSQICNAGTCTAPSPSDGVQNDSETDVDCGGALLASGAANPASDGAPACADDLGCAIDQDCLSGFCSLLTGRCVDGQSCKGLITPAQIMDPTSEVDAEGDAIGTPDPNGAGQWAGIDTCGQGEATDPPAEQRHESCCRSLLLPGSTTTRLDKYEVTAGRMRQFAESMVPPYDIRDWALQQVADGTPVGQVLASQIPTGLNGTTNVLELLPASADGDDPLNAVEQLGGTVVDPSNSEQGCFTGDGAYGASVYWWSASDLVAVGSPPRPFTQDYYDIKSMNCGLYWVYAAFCAWDGGRLPVITEVEAAYGPDAYPWGPNFLPYVPSLNNGSDYPYETLAEGQVNPNTGQVPLDYPSYQNVPLINQYAAANGTTPVAITVNWLNGSNANNGGSFYFYPGFVASDPPGTPDTLSSGLDLSPFIAAPGRFALDVTAALSPSYDGNEGWQDLGANMLELRAIDPGGVNTAGTNTLCDCTGNTAGGLGSCSCLTLSGVIRATGLPSTSYDGGSWEGHSTFNPADTKHFVVPAASDGDWPLWAQYGKIGFRCARPAEP
jgi:hypothetical protein